MPSEKLPALIAIFFSIVLFVLSAPAYANCHFPNNKDPDDVMDNIGRTEFCYPTDTRADRDPASREQFGNGIITSNGGNNSEGGRAVVLNPAGGGIYVAGRTNTGTNDFLILKYFADGSLDTSFDSDGKAIHSFGTTDDIAHGLVLQTNGQLIVAGRSDHGSANAYDFAVLRLALNGDLDTSFNTTGKTLVNVTGAADFGRGVALTTNGDVVLAGYGKNTDYDFAFARVTTDGRLDTAFASDGTYSVSNGTSDDGALAVAIDSDGSIVGAGDSYNGSDWDMAAVRLTSDGRIDTTFRTSGKLVDQINTICANCPEVAYTVAIGTAAGPVYAGVTNGGGGLDLAFIRLLSSGALDSAFNTDGKYQVSINGDDVANGIVLLTNGLTILAAGMSVGSNNDFLLARILSDGSLDTSFATDGSFTQAVVSDEDVAQGVSMLGNGVIVAAGRTDVGSGVWDVALMRVGSDGSLAAAGNKVLSFGTNGVKTVDFNGTDTAYGIQIDSSSRFLVIGNSSSNTKDVAVMRLLIDGNLDTSFFTSGKFERNEGGTDIGFQITLRTNGGIYFCAQGNSNISVGKMYPHGALDTTFFTDGTYSSVVGACSAAFVQDTGAEKLVVIADTGATEWNFRRTNGLVVDTSFHTDGDFEISVQMRGGEGDRSGGGNNTDDLRSGFLDTTNNYLWAVAERNGLAVTTLGIARFRTDGFYDTSFSSDGHLNNNLDGQNQNNIWRGGNSILPSSAAGSTDGTFLAHTANDATTVWIARFLSEGTLDTSFATDGKNSTAGLMPSGLVYAPNSKILESSDNVTTVAGFFISRWNTDGNLDTSFRTNGKTSDTSFATGGSSAGLVIAPNGWICGGGSNSVDMGVFCVWQ